MSVCIQRRPKQRFCSYIMRSKKKATKLRLIVADDHRLVRAGLCSLLSSSSSVEIVAEAGDGREVIRQIRRHRPDIVIMDIGMPNLNGIDALIRIKDDFPKTKVLIVSMHSDEEHIVRA